MADYKAIGVVAVLFLVVGVVLSMGSKVTQDIQSDLVEYSTQTGKQFWLPANSTTALTFDQDRVLTVEARNATGNELLTSANYTLTSTTIKLTTLSSYNGTNLNLTYTYEQENSVAYDNAGNSTQAVGKMAKYLPLMGLVVIASLILGTIGLAFTVKR